MAASINVFVEVAHFSWIAELGAVDRYRVAGLMWTS